MTRYSISDEYFDWLCDLIYEHKDSDIISFDRLLWHLHHVDFRFSIPLDENRAMDGIDLRWRFAMERDYEDVPDSLDGPCSVLEMMVALALRCEETIMDDPVMGNRTGQWFWTMIVNLGLGSMTDARYDARYINSVLDIFMNREYAPDGKGGLFYIRNFDGDMRRYEIWYQLNCYIKSIM